MDIEFLRVIAVCGVMAFHFAPGWVPAKSGYLGVDTFFVISGFVVTAQLLRLQQQNKFSYSQFLAARVRRLLPSALLVIVVTSAVSFVYGAPAQVSSEAQAGASASLYVSNFLFARRAVDYFVSADLSAFTHFWSLSVEEQFYLVWPIAILLVVAFSARQKGGIAQRVLLVAVVLGAASLVGAQWAMSMNPQQSFFMPWWRANELMAGAAVAALVSRSSARPPREGTWRTLIALLRWSAVLVVVVVLFQGRWTLDAPGFGALAVIIPVMTILASGDSSAEHSDLLTRLGGTRPLAAIAVLSYALYLWHWPVWLVVSGSESNGIRGWQLIAIATIATFVLAGTSHILVERPFHRGPILRRWPPLSQCLGALVVCGLVASTLVLAAGPIERTRSVGWTEQLTPKLSVADEDRDSSYAQGCFAELLDTQFRPCVDNPSGKKLVILVGDSHAAQWHDVVARSVSALDAKLVTVTRAGCTVWGMRNGYGQAAESACQSWRSHVESLIRRNHPAVVLVSESIGQTFVLDDGSVGSDEQMRDRRQVGITSTLKRWTRSARRVVLLADTPYADTKPANPLLCLAKAAAPSQCDFPRKSQTETRLAPVAIADDLARSGLSIRVVDPYSKICPTDPCHTVIDRTIVYWDSGHLTRTFAKTLDPWVRGWLASSLS